MTTVMDLTDVTTFNTHEMPVILRSTKDYGDIVSILITARGGVTLSDKAGTIEMVIKLMSSGTPSYTKEQIDHIFAESGAVFSIEPRMDYIEVSLKCLKKFLPTLLPVISEMVRSPLLKPEEVELARSQMMAELKNEEDHPDAVLHLMSHQAFYKGHPYFNRPNGYLDTVPKITREDLQTTLPKIFNKSNVFFTMIGDLTEDEAKNIVDSHFGGKFSLPEGEPGRIVTEVPKNDTKEIHYHKMSSPTTYFMAGFKAPALKDEDYPALVLATQILDNRLFEEVRTKRGLTYSVHCNLGNSASNGGSLYVSSTQLSEALKVIFDEVKKIQTELIDPKRIELQIRKFRSSWFLGRETSTSQTLIFSLYEAIGTGWRDANTFIGRLNTVTPEKLRAAAQNYLKDFTISIAGPDKVDVFKIMGTKPASKKAPGKAAKAPKADKPAEASKTPAAK